MKLFFLFILLAIAGICILRKGRGRLKNKAAVPARVRIAIIVENQEPWLEGFIMKIFHRLKDAPHVKVTIVDRCSRDGTLQMLRLLQRRYPFELMSAETGCRVETFAGSTGSGNETEEFICFDVRGLKGKKLLDAPLFCHLSQLNAGKIHILSK